MANASTQEARKEGVTLPLVAKARSEYTPPLIDGRRGQGVIVCAPTQAGTGPGTRGTMGPETGWREPGDIDREIRSRTR